MFKRQVTGKMSKRGEKLNRIVVATREKAYTTHVWEEGELVEIEIGRGWEIVKEINASDEGAKLYAQMVEAGTEGAFLRNLRS